VVLAAVRQQGLEGVVAKRLTSPYQPGQRSRAWKVRTRATADAVVGGVIGSLDAPEALCCWGFPTKRVASVWPGAPTR
jgi:hypothetical protein